MQLEIGQILKGKVVKITKFGAFVNLAPDVNGLVHISEISKSFVADVSNFLEIGDEVKVKVLRVDSGKLNLSIKQAQDLKPKPNAVKTKTNVKPKSFSNANPAVFKKPTENNANLSLEEMLSKFRKNSEEILANVKQRNRNFDNKRNSYSKKRH